jgi:hypothetical protein
MERLNAYSSPTPNGGVNVDTEGMAVDLITVLKMGGITKQQFLDFMSTTFDAVEVKISIPNEAKN